jgi:hypothetical protein
MAPLKQSLNILTPQNSRRILSEATLKKMIRLYLSGKSSTELALMFSVSSRTVLDALHREGIPIRKLYKFNSAVEAEICDGYRNQCSSIELAKSYKCSDSLIFDILRRSGVRIRPKRKLSDCMVARLPELYAKGFSLKTIGAMHRVCGATIGYRLKEAGIAMRGSRHESRRKYSVDPEAFSRETEQSLYWIGFLMADCSVDNFGTISVHLQIGDIRHLYKLRSFLNSDAPVKRKNGNLGGYKPGAPFASINVHCTTLVEHLARYGVIPNKTGKERFRKKQASEHLWRGLMDGDGTLGFHKRGYFYLKVYGSYAICSQFRLFALRLVPHCTANVIKSKGIYSFGLCCKPAEIVAKKLYLNCKVSLTRKMAVVRRLWQDA